MKDFSTHVFVRMDEEVKKLLQPVVVSISRVPMFNKGHFIHLMFVIKDVYCKSGVQGGSWSLLY